MAFIPVSAEMLPFQKQVGLELDPQYKLPKMRYKGGTPPPQFIRMQGGPGGGAAGGSSGGGSGAGPAAGGAASAAEAPAVGQAGAGSRGSTAANSKPLIAEVGSDGEEPPAFALLASKRQARQRQAPVQAQQQQPTADAPQAQRDSGLQPSTEQQPAAPVQLLPQIEYVGKPATEVCIRLQLPAAAAAAAQQDLETISTAVCAETVRVEAPGCAPLEVRLPFAVSAAGGSAELRPTAGSISRGGSSDGGKASGSGGSGAQLVLRLPYHPFSSVLEELRQAAGAAEGQPSGGGGSMMDLD